MRRLGGVSWGFYQWEEVERSEKRCFGSMSLNEETFEDILPKRSLLGHFGGWGFLGMIV